MQTRSRKVTSFSACKANGIASINKARGVSAINKAKGFTLIEVLVASFILFLVIGTNYHLQRCGQRNAVRL